MPELPDAARQDPTFRRAKHELYGPDGCRVPIPLEAESPAAGFSPWGATWLPRPSSSPLYARDSQVRTPDSTLECYRHALALRREHDLGIGELTWDAHGDLDVVTYTNGGITVVANTGSGLCTCQAVGSSWRVDLSVTAHSPVTRPSGLPSFDASPQGANALPWGSSV